MSKPAGADAEGPRGSRTERDHGGADAWNPKAGKRDEAANFDQEKATRDAERNQKRQGKP